MYKWDIICLQECDVHEEIFADHPVFKGARLPNGTKWSCAIYYNSNRFEEVESGQMNYHFEEQSQHCVGRVFREKLSGIEFAVLTTHLKAKVDFEEMRTK